MSQSAQFAYDVGLVMSAIGKRYGDKITATTLNNVAANPSAIRLHLRHLDISDFDIPKTPEGWTVTPASSFWIGYYHGQHGQSTGGQ